MVFYILISIVFLAELVITCSVVSHLLKWDKIIIGADEFIDEAKPKIREIAKISRKISEQLIELTPIFVENIKNFFIKLALENIKSLLAGVGVWVAKEYIKKHYKIGL